MANNLLLLLTFSFSTVEKKKKWSSVWKCISLDSIISYLACHVCVTLWEIKSRLGQLFHIWLVRFVLQYGKIKGRLVWEIKSRLVQFFHVWLVRFVLTVWEIKRSVNSALSCLAWRVRVTVWENKNLVSSIISCLGAGGLFYSVGATRRQPIQNL